MNLVKEKLKQDLPLLTDDKLFSSTIDETIILMRQINFLEPKFFDLIPESNPIRVFVDHKVVLDRFIQLEYCRK